MPTLIIPSFEDCRQLRIEFSSMGFEVRLGHLILCFEQEEDAVAVAEAILIRIGRTCTECTRLQEKLEDCEVALGFTSTGKQLAVAAEREAKRDTEE